MRTVETRRRFLRCHVAKLIAEPRLCVRRHGRRTLRSLADGPPVITISIGRLADRSRENDVTMKIKLECLSSLPSEQILSEGCGPRSRFSRQSKASVPAVREYHAARARPVRYALFGKPVGMLAHNVVLGQPGRLCGRRSRRRGLGGFRQRAGSQGRPLGGLLFHYFSLTRNAGEHAVEVGADRVDRNDDGNRDTGCDQAILADRSCAGSICAETGRECRYKQASCLSSPYTGARSIAYQEFRFCKFMRELKRQLRDSSRELAQPVYLDSDTSRGMPVTAAVARRSLAKFPSKCEPHKKVPRVRAPSGLSSWGGWCGPPAVILSR